MRRQSTINNRQSPTNHQSRIDELDDRPDLSPGIDHVELRIHFPGRALLAAGRTREVGGERQLELALLLNLIRAERKRAAAHRYRRWDQRHFSSGIPGRGERRDLRLVAMAVRAAADDDTGHR